MKVETDGVFSSLGAYTRMNSPTRLLFRSPKSSSRIGRFIVPIGAWVVASVLIYYSYGPLHDHFVPILDGEEFASVADNPLIPRKIWQIYLSPPNEDREKFQIKPSSLSDTPSWLALNPGYDYNLVGDKQAEEILNMYYKDNTTLLDIYHDLKNTGMKSDFLRYMILSAEGGVYADTDVTALKPVDEWVPEEYKNVTRAIVGIEFDRLDGLNWGEVHEDIQICSWTLAAAPAHPIYTSGLNKVAEGLLNYMAKHNTTFSEINVPIGDILQLTGPTGWTDVVFSQLQEYDPELTHIRNLTGMTSPRLVGDVLILPIDGFGMGQPHSNSTNDGSIPEGAFVKHNFRGSWRHDDDKPEEQKPEEQKPEEHQPEENKPEENKQEEQNPEEQKPEEQKPEEPKPEEQKPEENKPEEHMQEQQKPDEHKPEETKTEEQKVAEENHT